MEMSMKVDGLMICVMERVLNVIPMAKHISEAGKMAGSLGLVRIQMRLPSMHLDRRELIASGLRPALALALLSPLNLPAHAISATTMSGKSRPELGVILVEAANSAGSTISGEMVLAGGKIGVAAFESKFPLAEGGYYDIESKAKEGGEGAFVQVAPLPKGQSLSTLKKDWFLATICDVTGRYGAYGAPVDGKVLADDKGSSDKRLLDVSFNVLRPDGAEAPRKAVVSAVQPAGTSEVVLLVSSAPSAAWKKGGEAEARKSAASFRVATRPTELKQEPSADYRFGKSSGPSSMKSRNDGF